MEEKINSVIAQGLLYILKYQEKNGGFSDISFHTSLILLCLERVKNDPRSGEIIRCGVNFLLREKSKSWSWNYWKRDLEKAKTLPDDLDDTSAALSALCTHVPEVITEEVLVSVINTFISAETKEGGPYFTWLVPEELRTEWDDVDIVVNSNIANFLAMKEIELPSLTEYIEERVMKGDFESNYYSPLAVLYFVSRWYQGGKGFAFAALLKTEFAKLGSEKNPLEIALYISTYLRFGGEYQDILPYTGRLIESKEDLWQPFALYVEEVHNGIPTFSGSGTLTAACVIEALSLVQEVAKSSSSKEGILSFQKSQVQTIVSLIQKIFAPYPKGIQEIINLSISKITSSDSRNEITLLPQFFYDSLKEEYKILPLEEIQGLCIASLLGWIGYSMYDDILDGQGTIALIPVANICVREVSNILKHLTKDERSRETVSRILNGIDETNFWEHHSCRARKVVSVIAIPETLPDYGDFSVLAKKSLGHALGPIVIAFAGGGPCGSAAGELLEDFFTNYLIARQLNDDAHDWFSDLEQGFLNPVSIQIITRFQEKYPSRHEIYLDSDGETLQEIFWREIIDTVAREIAGRATRALQTLENITILQNPSYLKSLLIPLINSAEKALRERDSALKFIQVYHS